MAKRRQHQRSLKGASAPRARQAFSPTKQLSKLLRRYPIDGLDAEGLILDYTGRSGKSIGSVCDLNSEIYKVLFTGSETKAGRRLIQSLVVEPTRAETLSECGLKYPEIASIVKDEVLRQRGGGGAVSGLVIDPSAALGYSVKAVVWHLSDIHFGKLNQVQSDPKELAFMLARLAVRFRKLVPDVVVISGDVSSCASDDEFKAFRVFCEELSMALWEEPCPWKILVVPGNHDVTWMSNGAADQMAGFRRHFSADDVCLTPFGTAEREFADGNVVVRRVNSRPSSVPPFAVVTYRNYGLDILLLVSGYFSGEIIPDIRNKLSCIGVTGSDSDFIDLLRLDRGSVDHEYLFWIDKCFTERKNLALGVIHHNPVQYGIQTCENPMAPELMETLWRKGIRVLLHGHVHLSEANSSQRPPVPFRAYPMPAPTLCSVTTAGSGRGINILFVGRDGSGTRIDTLVWSFTESLAFNTGDAVLRYRLALRDGELEIFSGKAR